MMGPGWRSSALSETGASGKRGSVGASPIPSLRRFAPHLDITAALSSVRLLANVRAQALADRDRWPLWLPVALGSGIACYFALPFEPAWPWALVAAGFVLVAGALSAASESMSWRFGLALLAAASLGFAVVKVRTETVARACTVPANRSPRHRWAFGIGPGPRRGGTRPVWAMSARGGCRPGECLPMCAFR